MLDDWVPAFAGKQNRINLRFLSHPVVSLKPGVKKQTWRISFQKLHNAMNVNPSGSTVSDHINQNSM